MKALQTERFKDSTALLTLCLVSCAGGADATGGDNIADGALPAQHAQRPGHDAAGPGPPHHRCSLGPYCFETSLV